MRRTSVLVVALLVMPQAAANAQQPKGTASLLADDAPGVTSTALGYVPPQAPNAADGSETIVSKSDGVREVAWVPVHPSACVTVGGFQNVPSNYIPSAIGSAECIVPTQNPLVAPEPAPGSPMTPEQLAKIAADKAMSLADPPRLDAAPGGIGLTGLPSYVWLEREPRPVIATAQVPGLTVTAEATPVEYQWDFGDGTVMATTESGRPWSKARRGSISHTYTARGRYTLTVQVVWQGRWRVNGGTWRHLGYFTNSDSRPHPVRQVRAVLTRSRR